MPIKFRCRHCEQLLGIAKSQAGALVDCPQCGRSIRVPELDGRTRKMPSRAPQTADDSLMTALSELSALDGGDQEDEIASVQPVAVERVTPAAVERQFAVSAEPIVSPDAIEVETEWPEENTEPVYSDSPVAVEESLEQLASLDSGEEAVSSDLLAEMRATRRVSWLTMPSIALMLLGLAGGTALGWWLTTAGFLPFRDSDASAKSGTHESEVSLPAGDSTTPAPGTADVVYTGTIEYQDANGRFVPDTGALVLLLPRKRKGDLLDARPLRNTAGDLEREAVVAALHSAGATLVLAGEEGAYAAPTAAKSDYQLIVISRHVQRPDDIPVATDVIDVLAEWFASPLHVSGRLAIQMASVSKDGRPVDFQFAMAE